MPGKYCKKKRYVQTKEATQYRAKKLKKECAELKLQLSGALQKLQETQAESHDLLQSADDELADCWEKIMDLQNRVQALEQENDGLRRKLNGMNGISLLIMGDTNEFYENETKDIILDELYQSLDHIPQKTRRRELIQGVLKANDFQHRQEERQSQVKRILKGPIIMTPSLKKGLESLGFQVNYCGKHAKCEYYGDDRYVAVMPLTGRDYRAGMNQASEIIKFMM